MKRKHLHLTRMASGGRAPETAETPAANEIATLAYQLWEARGCPEGSPEEDWLRAERQLAAASAAPGHMAA